MRLKTRMTMKIWTLVETDAGLLLIISLRIESLNVANVTNYYSAQTVL